MILNIKFMKKYWLFAVLIIIIFFLFLVRLFSPAPTPVSSPSPSPSPVSFGLSWQGIVPGKTLENELEKILGGPLKKEVRENYLVYFYSTSPNLPEWLHEVYLLQNRVVFIKEKMAGEANKNLKTYFNQYGQPTKIFYGPYSPPYIYHLFSEKGFLVVADPDSQNVLEAWYFQPTTTEDFGQKWGKELSLTKPKRF